MDFQFHNNHEQSNQSLKIQANEGYLVKVQNTQKNLEKVTGLDSFDIKKRLETKREFLSDQLADRRRKQIDHIEKNKHFLETFSKGNLNSRQSNQKA